MVTKFKIEKQISLPNNRQKYPFRELKVGESFFISHDNNALSARSNAYLYCHKNKGVRFTCRNVEGGVRIWRTA